MIELILISVIAVSSMSLVGVLFLAFKEAWLGRILPIMVAFASGNLLGGAFFHLLPESRERADAFFFVVYGILIFFLMEKFLYWRHCHDQKCNVHSFVYLNLIGDGLHNFLDGAIIAASFLSDISLGIASSLAIALHEIPQEIGDFGILIYGGLAKFKALIFNFLSAITAIIGALIVYFFSISSESTAFLLPLAAGGFIYIACVDLFPELHENNKLSESLIQALSILIGIGLMYVLKLLME